MGIIFLTFAVFVFLINVTKCGKRLTIFYFTMAIVYILSCITLNLYLETSIGWEYGVAGADLEAYFKTATALHDGIPLDQLGLIDFRFEYKFSNIGYFIYTFIIYLQLYLPTIFDIHVSLYILYITQIFIALISVLNISIFFKRKYNISMWISSLILLTCLSIFQSTSVLMRDIWILFLISLLLKMCTLEKKHYILGIAIIVATALLRNYSLILTIPIFFAYLCEKKKVGIIVSLLTTVVLLFGGPIIQIFADLSNVGWTFDYSFDIMNIINYLALPNIINQSYNVLNITPGFHSVFGGNTEVGYYLLSLWNLFIYPLALIGIVYLLKNNDRTHIFMWLLALLNVALLYGIFYDGSSEPRHKLMILCSLVFFASNGCVALKKESKQLPLLYFATVSILSILFIVVRI